MLKNRTELARYFNELGFKHGAEIGVLGGKYSVELCKAGMKVYCIDSWGINEIRLHDYHLRKYEVAKIALDPYNAVLIRMLSMDAVKNFKDDSLDFVFIDANHRYGYVKNDIIEWTKKVKKGGIVSGHDYLAIHGCDVKTAVDEYVKEHNISLEITGCSLRSRDKDERVPCWYFFKK